MKLFKKDPIFYGKVFTIAIPIALQSLISIGVNMLDTIMVGSLGDHALSATSLANSFISIYHIFCMGLGMGASVLVSRYWGMKNSDSADNSIVSESANAGHALKQTVALMLRLALALAAIFAILTIAIPGLLMKMYTPEAEIIRLGSIYFKWSVITYFFLGSSLVSTIVLRSVGEVRFPLFVSIGAFFVNLGANYTFIFGKFGAPRMEIAGAALGTLIARIFEAACILTYLLVIDKRIGFRIKDFFMNTGSLIGEYIRISIPVLISDAILAIGTNSVSMVIGRLGATFVSANAITAVTQQLSTVVIQGVSQAGAIVTGQTLGMGDRKKTMEQGWMFLGLGIGLGAVSALFIIIAKNPVISSFKDVSDEARAIAQQLMWAISLVIVFQATNSIMTKGVLRGGGDTKLPTISFFGRYPFLSESWQALYSSFRLSGFMYALSPTRLSRLSGA